MTKQTAVTFNKFKEIGESEFDDDQCILEFVPEAQHALVFAEKAENVGWVSFFVQGINRHHCIGRQILGATTFEQYRQRFIPGIPHIAIVQNLKRTKGVDPLPAKIKLSICYLEEEK